MPEGMTLRLRHTEKVDMQYQCCIRRGWIKSCPKCTRILQKCHWGWVKILKGCGMVFQHSWLQDAEQSLPSLGAFTPKHASMWSRWGWNGEYTLPSDLRDDRIFSASSSSFSSVLRRHTPIFICPRSFTRSPCLLPCRSCHSIETSVPRATLLRSMTACSQAWSFVGLTENLYHEG